MTRSSKGFLEMSDYSRVAALSRRMLLAGAAATCVLASLPFASASAANPAEAFMDKIGRQVVALFENKSLSDDQRLSKLVDLLDASVDFNTVARLVIGRFWRQASTQQRDEYAKLFREFTIVTIASQLRNYGGETYQITGSRVVDDRDTVVSSKIFRENGQPPTNVDWRVRKGGRRPEGHRRGGRGCLCRRYVAQRIWRSRAEQRLRRRHRPPEGADRGPQEAGVIRLFLPLLLQAKLVSVGCVGSHPGHAAS